LPDEIHEFEDRRDALLQQSDDLIDDLSHAASPLALLRPSNPLTLYLVLT
jgi:hypothetical protein